MTTKKTELILKNKSKKFGLASLYAEAPTLGFAAELMYSFHVLAGFDALKVQLNELP
jgi:hypothetical protein